MKGYESALTNKENAKFFQIPHDRIQDGVNSALQELIETGRYDGVFCVNNSIAKAILKASRSWKSELNELRIISFDDIEIFDLVNPKISSVAQPIEQIGLNAVELLIDRLDKKQEHKIEQRVLETTLIKR